MGGVLRPAGFSRFILRVTLLSAAGNPVVVWSYGATTGAKLRVNWENHFISDSSARPAWCDEAARRRNFERVKGRATAIFADWATFDRITHGQPNNLFFWPIDLAADSGNRYRRHILVTDTSRPLRIVHAPNHACSKARISRAGGGDLKRAGGAGGTGVVERVPKPTGARDLPFSDVIFDNVSSDFTLLPLEGMALGKPVMCFIRNRRVTLLNAAECRSSIRTRLRWQKDIMQLVNNRNDLSTSAGGAALHETHFRRSVRCAA